MKDRRSSYVYGSVFLVGASVGWLTGLSISPVIGSVLTAVLALTTAVLAAAMGVRDSSEGSYTIRGYRFSVAPLAVFSIALALGAGLGVEARTRHWLEPSPDAIIQEWAKRGLDRGEVTARLFESRYPAGVSKKGEPSDSKKDEIPSPAVNQSVLVNRSVLFQISDDECQRLSSAPADALSAELKTTYDARVRSFAEKVVDEKALRALVDVICAK